MQLLRIVLRSLIWIFSQYLIDILAMGCDITEICQNGHSLDMYLIKTSLLIELIETREQTGYTCMKDVVKGNQPFNTLCIMSIRDIYLLLIQSSRYYVESMKLLNPSEWNKLFIDHQPIYTKVKDEPPTRYLKSSSIKHAMVANGCIIDGTIENSIISRGVRIGKGAVIKNSIIMQKCTIGDNCIIDSAILDKDVKIEKGTVMKGTSQIPLVIRKGYSAGRVDLVKVLFTVSECVPFIKSGGLADVAGSLPKELRRLGTDVRVIMPKYGSISKSLNKK